MGEGDVAGEEDSEYCHGQQHAEHDCSLIASYSAGHKFPAKPIVSDWDRPVRTDVGRWCPSQSPRRAGPAVPFTARQLFVARRSPHVATGLAAIADIRYIGVCGS